MTRIRIPLSEQIEYMERHRDKGSEMLKSNPSVERAVDVSQAIVMTLTAYQAFEHEMKGKTR
jgi:hypothetical protein